MGIGTAEEVALAEVKATEQLSATKVQGHDADLEPLVAEVETRCPVTGTVSRRPRVQGDPIIWTAEAWERLQLVPLVARPLARNTVERFARNHEIWRVTTRVMDENKQQMIEADEFDIDTMMVMFTELRRSRSAPKPSRALRRGTRCPPRCGLLSKTQRRKGSRAVRFGTWRTSSGNARSTSRPSRLRRQRKRWSACCRSRRATDVDYVPHVVAWNLTRRCDLECAHCYIAAGPSESAAGGSIRRAVAGLSTSSWPPIRPRS